MWRYKLQHMYVFLALLNIFSVNTYCIAEEGNNYSLDCRPTPSYSPAFRWRTYLNNKERDIQICFTDRCLCENPINITGGYKAVVLCDNMMLTSKLTIESVSRHSTQNDGVTWACYNGNNVVKKVCDPLVIYAKPEKPTCSKQELQPGDTQLSITCVTNKVYPKAECQLYNKRDTLPLALAASSIFYNHSRTNTDPDYFKTTCKINLDVSTLGVGQHQLFVKMFPNVTDGLNIAGNNSDIMSVNLSYPQVEMSSNCFNGTNVKGNFIKSGTISSCTCTMTNTGNPPGQIQWYRQGNSTPIGNLVSDRSVRFTITEENTAGPHVYYCQATSALARKIPTVEFRREFASKPEKPTCSKQELQPGDTQLSITCVTNKVNPKAECQLYNNRDTLPLALAASSIFYNHSRTNTDPDYFKTTCKINLDVSTLGVGQHQLFVKMFPNVTDGLNIAGNNSDIMSVNLSYPQVEMSSNCFNGTNVKGNFIKSGTISSCTCTMTNTGNPPGQIQWYRQGNSTPIGNLVSDRSVRFTITEENTAGPHVYYCQATSALARKIPTVEFRREFAYGPRPVTLVTDGTSFYDVCPDDSPTVLTVSCQVPIDSVNPKPVFVVSFGNQQPTSRQESSTSAVYKGDYTFSLNTGGIHQLLCDVMNSVFGDLHVGTSKNITVRGPPATTPTIKISDGHYSGMNGNVAIVTSDITISCYSEGGYPLPDMNLWCQSDHDYSSTSQGKTELNLKFEAKKKSDKCFCIAKYMNSRCPTNKTSSVILVFYEDSASVDEAVMVGGYFGLIGFPLILLVIVVLIVLKKTGKLTRCGKPSSDQEQKQFPDTVRPVEDFESSVSMSQHQNEAFDGYEVPVNFKETNVDAKSKSPDRLKSSKPVEKGDGVTAYENTI